MPSEIMERVLAAERGCDEKKAAAKAQANEILSEAEKKAAAMRREAEAFAKAKANAIIKAAAADAKRQTEDGDAENARQAAALREATAEKTAEAVRQTALYLLELS
jgi:F-type H+-transporting ATPase subunit b